MSAPMIPNITPIIGITPAQSIALMLSSIAFEELALAHIVNAEAEKIQFVVGTLQGANGCCIQPSQAITISDLISVNTQVSRTLQAMVKQEILLQFKLDNIVDLVAAL